MPDGRLAGDPRPAPMGGAPSPFEGEIPQLLKEKLTERRMADATASPKTDLNAAPPGAAPAKSEPMAKNEPAAAPPISGPTEGGKFDLSSLLGQIGGYAQDPRVLGGLAAGGLGAYGLSRLLRRKKRRPELE